LHILRLPILLPVQDAAASNSIYYAENVCYDSKGDTIHKENNKIFANPVKERLTYMLGMKLSESESE